MKDKGRTKEQLLAELSELRQRVAELEAAEAERMRAQEALRRAEREKESILDAQLEHVIYEDSEMLILWANQAACDSVNMNREDLIGRHCYEIWPQRDEPCEDCPVIASMKTGRSQSGEKTTLDGRSWFIRGYPVRDANGEIIGAIEVTRDITERVRTQESLRESEERYRALFEGVPLGLYRTTVEGQILDANLALVQMLGYPDRESLLAANAADLYVEPEDRKREQALLERRGVVRDFEAQLRRHDGTIIWVRDRTRAVQDANGGVLYYEGSLEDITERVRAQEVLQRRMEQLTALSQASRAVTASLDPDQVLAEVVSLTNEVVASDYVSVVLVDEEGRMGRSTENLPGVPAIEYRVRDEGLTSLIIRSHQPVVVEEIGQDGVMTPPTMLQTAPFGA